jgi:RCC1 and BTB domain-containing protein
MLSENWSESGSKELEITQYSYSVFYAFIKYLYSDCVDIKVEEAFDLIDLSNYYCEEKLRHKCDYIIKTGINVKNACALYCAAVEHNFRHLEEYCFKFALNNLNEILLTDSYSKMDDISRKRFDKRLKLKV